MRKKMTGAVDSGVLMGLIMIAIAFILFPIVITGTETILAWTTTGGNSTLATFTGLSSVVGIAPMMIFVFVVFGGIGMTSVGAFRSAKTGKTGMNLLLSLIMLAIAFVVYPIVLDGADTILSDANIADYTGLSSIAAIAPLLVFVAMLFAGIGIGGYTGYRAVRRRRG